MLRRSSRLELSERLAAVLRERDAVAGDDLRGRGKRAGVRGEVERASR